MRARLLLPAILALLAAGCAERTPPGPEIWRFAIEETRGSVQDAYASRFAELVEQRSGGAVHVEVYPYGSLGTSDQTTELLYDGTLELAMASPGHLSKLLPEVGVFLLHFVLSDDAEVNTEVLSDPALLARFDALYARKGFKLLSIYSEGWQVWTTHRPIRKPSDFDGLKFRVMTSPLLLAAYGAYGASPTPLPYSEVYSALQLNMIDGQVNPVFAIEEMSFYEVTDWMIFANQAPFITTVAANRDFYQGLSPERRRLVDGVISDLRQWIPGLVRRYNDERLEIIRRTKPGMHILRLDEQQRAAFRRAAAGARDAYLELADPDGQAILDQLRAAVKKAEAKAGATGTASGDAP